MKKNDVKFHNIQELKKILLNSIRGENAKNFIVILGIIGIFLIFISGMFKTNKTNDEKPILNSANSETYARSLEKSLEEIISGIKNAGKTKILVTIEADSENIYATEEKKNNELTEDNFDGETTRKRTSNDSEKKFITIRDGDGSERALKITEIQPKIKGVVAVCEGGEIPEVRKKIIEVITTALGINSRKVCVTK